MFKTENNKKNELELMDSIISNISKLNGKQLDMLHSIFGVKVREMDIYSDVLSGVPILGAQIQKEGGEQYWSEEYAAVIKNSRGDTEEAKKNFADLMRMVSEEGGLGFDVSVDRNGRIRVEKK